MTTYAQQASSGKDHSGNTSGSNHHHHNNSHHNHHHHHHHHHNNNSNNIQSHHDAASHKKEEFRKYLEKTGVLESLTKVLVGLYEEPERPQNAIDYIKRYLGSPSNVDVAGLEKENQQLKQEVERLRNMLKGKGGGGTAVGGMGGGK